MLLTVSALKKSLLDIYEVSSFLLYWKERPTCSGKN